MGYHRVRVVHCTELPLEGVQERPVSARPAWTPMAGPGGRPWLMSAEATPKEVDEYLAKRRAQGFNSFYLMAMVDPHGYEWAAPNAPNDRRGDSPFATPGVFSTAGATPASMRYWAWIDSIIDKAAARNMVVMLAYCYLGAGGLDQGWYKETLNQPSRRALFNWGAWLG